MHNFDFVKPGSVDEAVTALSGGDAMALGGGQTLIPTMKARLNAPATLVSTAGIATMHGVRRDGDTLVIGGATTHATVAREAAAHFPALADLASHIGDPAVRNRGTIGGSLANNDPAACYPAAALATGATIVTNTREIAADDYFQGMFDTALEEGELITEVRLPIPSSANYQKFLQPASRFALVGVFLANFSGQVRVAVTGASEDGVHRWSAAEDALTATFSSDAIDPLNVPHEGLIADLHGSPQYRAHLTKILTKRATNATAG